MEPEWNVKFDLNSTILFENWASVNIMLIEIIITLNTSLTAIGKSCLGVCVLLNLYRKKTHVAEKINRKLVGIILIIFK
jgi:hypothetical protein